MYLPLEEQDLCRRNISDHEQSKEVMPLPSPHEQNFSDVLANSNGDSERLGLESGG